MGESLIGAEGATAPVNSQAHGPSWQRNSGEWPWVARRRDNDLRQTDRGGIAWDGRSLSLNGAGPVEPAFEWEGGNGRPEANLSF